MPDQLIPLKYVIRVSNRTKYLRLTVSLDKGVVVVVPHSMSKRQMSQMIPEFVKDKQFWIRETIEKLRAKKNTQKNTQKNIEQCQLPKLVELPALAQAFSIQYHIDPDLSCSDTPVKLYHQEEFQLEIRANHIDKMAIFELLELFFKNYAKHYLKLRLDKLSEESKLPYKGLTVRAQKTRWGSCSAKKNINLNYRLLFIKEGLLDYILLHELVHTVHMNHSKAFWEYLELLMPDARERDTQLNKIANDLPCWIYYK